jgi:hypothetical protein
VEKKGGVELWRREGWSCGEGRGGVVEKGGVELWRREGWCCGEGRGGVVEKNEGVELEKKGGVTTQRTSCFHTSR